MPGLATFKPQTETVKLGEDQEVVIRGLSITDLGAILHEHANTLDGLYKEHIIGAGEEPPEIDTLMRALMTEAPQAMASIIAHAADEPELSDVVLTMPGMDQIKLLLAVAALTFKSEEEVGKIAEALIRGMQAITSTVQNVADQSLLEA